MKPNPKHIPEVNKTISQTKNVALFFYQQVLSHVLLRYVYITRDPFNINICIRI